MAELTVDKHRQQMMHWLQSARPYEFLTMAGPYLDVCREDHQVRLLAVQEYLKLGLVQPARELLETDALDPAAATELAPIRSSLAKLTKTDLPWPQHTDQFEANLTVLTDRGIDVTPIRSAWENGTNEFQRFRDNAGLDQIRRRRPSGGWMWIPRLGDHRTVDYARELPEGIGEHMPGPYLFEGLDVGWYFQRVYESTHNTFLGYSCALYVVEHDPSALAMVFHLHDWRELLSDPRVYWVFGEACVERLREILAADPDLPIPRQAFRAGGTVEDAESNVIPTIENVGEQRLDDMERTLQELEHRYATRDVAYWARRFDDALNQGGQPLRILAAVSTHTTFLQYSMRDAKRAFESLGHQCTVLTEKSPHHHIAMATYHRAIRDLDPDIFFNIDHIRAEFADIIPKNLPVLTWDQDQLPSVFTKDNIQQIGPLDFVAGAAKALCVRAGGNEGQFLYARVPTCPEQFGGDPLTEEEQERFTCDVSYVSHASQTPRAFHDEERETLNDPPMQHLLDTMYEFAMPRLTRHSVMTGPLAKTILSEAAQRCDMTIDDPEVRNRLTGWYLWRLGDRIFRQEALEWAAAWARSTGRSLRIYGNGWDKHPTLAPFAAGPAENGRDLLCVYRASKINLQLMPAGFIHQRALDGLTAGGFFLSRKTPDDVLGRTLRQLLARMTALGVASTTELLDHPDPALQRLLHRYWGDWLHTVERDKPDFFNYLRFLCEEPYPDEVFEDFEQILFDSPESFAEKADAFLSDDTRRTSVASAMRGVVIDRFSYPPTIRRFLSAMTAYLHDKARRNDDAQ